ncbi:MAG TPA: hypothetical protein VI485_00750 [Vicinamibacterales bacterium]|nr:hypothetical protein [Vicinamibacterales bacterium]
MTYARAAAATFAAFLVSNLSAIAVHGFILAQDYAPYEGTLLRDQVGWQALLLPVAHLCFICGLVWVYARVPLGGSAAVRGLKIGVVGWMMGQAPLWLLWYAEQPWPGDLVVKQLGLELLSSLVIGVTIALVAGQSVPTAVSSAQTRSLDMRT